MKRTFSIIVAHDKKLGIGINNQLPWHLPSDMEHFKKLTSTAKKNKLNAVIMGRKTWESIPEKFRPLKNRLNIILTQNTTYKSPKSTYTAINLKQALNYCDDKVESIFIIGGEQLYKEALTHIECTSLYTTIIEDTFKCDCYFPNYTHLFSETSRSETKTENGLSFSFLKFTRI